MIELYLKNNHIKKVATVDEIRYELKDIFNIRIIDYSETDLQVLAEKFQLDIAIFNRKEDIEISSHFLKMANQLSFNLSIPSYSSTTSFQEQEIFILIKEQVVFYFLSSVIDKNFVQLTRLRYDFESIDFKSHLDHFVFQIGIISDYYADLTELISKQIKQLFQRTLKAQSFIEKDLDLITALNFNNLLIKESINNFRRILILLVRTKVQKEILNDKISLELGDIAVISEHIQYNFDRLDDLKENINSKIDLEQNKIFRTLTIITVCISLPTLIAGIYGMNFAHIPELKWNYGYPLAIALMVVSFISALIYFRKIKWFK